MAQRVVGIRELKERLSRHMRHVKAGHTLVITERGKPIGRIVPVKQSTAESKTKALVEAGLVGWSGNKLASRTPVAKTRGKRTVADLLLENRE